MCNEFWHDALGEPVVREPFRGHEQYIDVVGVDALFDRGPRVVVAGRIDAFGAYAPGLGAFDLVTHERDQRRHDQRRTVTLGS